MSHSDFPRQFVRRNDALCEWSQIEPYFQSLLDRVIDTPERLNEWLCDCSELAACIDEIGKERYVRMTCQTDDSQRKQAYLDFVENIEPKCKPMWHALDRKYAACPAAGDLPAERFEVFNRSVKTRVELYRDENIPLEVEQARLQQKYQQISAAMTATYDGKEQTLEQLASYMERTDRAVRQEVWELSVHRRLRDVQTLEELFDDLLKLRHRMAQNAGLSDFRAYAFKDRERFDYTPEDCIAFHQAVETECVPLLRTQQAVRRDKLGLETLRPWDLGVDVMGRAPLKPFDHPDELVHKCTVLFERLDPEWGEQFREMARRGDLELESRKGKAPGAYQSTFHESRRPFIFMNTVGMHRDVRTLVHEGGHAFHTLSCRNDPLMHYRSAPIEFAEVASMGMEMLAYDRFDVFYSGADLARAKRHQLEGIVTILPWIATVDAFQHWIYTHPDHTRDERREQWLGLHERFGGLEDYSGYEEVLAHGWQRQLHLFEVPFYFIEYGIAQLGALQIWDNARRNGHRAINDYRRALVLGGSRPLPELFRAANIKFDFSIETLGPLMQLVQEELRSVQE